MAAITSCFGRKRIRLEDEEALLAQYDDSTALQQKLHGKLHSYQMIRAISQGYMPSNEQLVLNLKTLLTSDALNSDNPELSDHGRRLLQLCKQWLNGFIDLMMHKNGKDQIQDFVWCLARARLNLDPAHALHRAKQNRAHADTVAAYESLRTIGSLLLMNSDFRLFLDDLGIIGRQVFADSAFSLSQAAESMAEQVRPRSEETTRLTGPGMDGGEPPNAQDLEEGSKAVARAVSTSLAQTGEDAYNSAKDKLSGQAKETTLSRLKQAVLKLRKRPDYQDSVSTIGILIRRYAKVYSQAAGNAVEEVQADIQANQAVDDAIKNFWQLLTSFGDAQEWSKLQELGRRALRHADEDPDFEALMGDVGTAVEDMLLDPDFFDHADDNIDALTEKARSLEIEEVTLKEEVEQLTDQARRTWWSVVRDEEVQKLIRIGSRIFAIVDPHNPSGIQHIWNDCLHVLVPAFVQVIQHIPLPRLELSTPDVDLLMENLILEPGHSVNNSSFLPFRLRIETQNNVEIRKARFRTHSSLKSFMTIKLDGLSIRADELGFWMRAHSGLARVTDEGIASFRLDERGMDIHIDVEICQEKMEQILTLKDVRVRVHRLDYALRKSKFAWLAWLLKPLLRPILRKTIERELSSAIEKFLHAANREMLYARERLRATRIADPQSVINFIKAIVTRLTPEEDPDVYTSFGVKPSGNAIFRDRYAPGSLVKLWEEEGRRAAERIEDFHVDGWRNEIFDLHVTAMT